MTQALTPFETEILHAIKALHQQDRLASVGNVSMYINDQRKRAEPDRSHEDCGMLTVWFDQLVNVVTYVPSITIRRHLDDMQVRLLVSGSFKGREGAWNPIYHYGVTQVGNRHLEAGSAAKATAGRSFAHS